MTEAITEIVVVLDRSGSMGSLRDDTIGGFNSMVEDQKKANTSKCRLTLVQFDNQYEVNYMGKEIEDVEPLNYETYQPRGGTALHDAIGKTINGLMTRHAALPEEEKPGQVIMVIITDGEENRSGEFRGKVKDMIKNQVDNHEWDFMYLGAGIDEIQIAEQYGMSANAVSSYDATKAAVGSTYSNVSGKLGLSRDLYSKGATRQRRSVAADADWKTGIIGTQNTEVATED